MDQLIELLNNNQGVIGLVSVIVAIFGFFIGKKLIKIQHTTKKHIDSPHIQAGRDINVGRDIIVNDKERDNSRAKLSLSLENPQAGRRPVVLENPERGFLANDLYLVVYNHSEVDADNLEVRLGWPPEGFSALDIWDATGNDRSVWRSIHREKVYTQNETVYAGGKREVGVILVKRFDGEKGKIIFKLNAKNANPVDGEVIITKEIDPYYVGK